VQQTCPFIRPVERTLHPRFHSNSKPGGEIAVVAFCHAMTKVPRAKRQLHDRARGGRTAMLSRSRGTRYSSFELEF
jgi:hypothetical protein